MAATEQLKTLQCDMRDECKNDVTMLEEKGWVYCENHGLQRRAGGRRVRKLRPHELNRLKAGKQLTRY